MKHRTAEKQKKHHAESFLKMLLHFFLPPFSLEALAVSFEGLFKRVVRWDGWAGGA